MPYIDSRGVEMPEMTYSEALELVQSLAASNVPDPTDVAFGDAGMGAMRRRHQAAADFLEDFIVNHHEELDDAYPAPSAAADYPTHAIADDSIVPPDSLSGAIKICLASAKQVAIEPESVDGVDQADECDRQQQAFDVTENLLGIHGADLDAKLTVIRLPSGFLG